MKFSLSWCRLSFGLVCLLGATALFGGEPPETFVSALSLAPGWKASEPVRVAVGDGLFELIDGGAELYHEFGFKRVASLSIENRSSGGIQIELYEMADAGAAFGVWSLMQTGTYTRGELGQGSLRFRYYVAFWSGAYFASVTGDKAEPAAQAEVDRLAAQLADRLPRAGTLPAWFDRLPAGSLTGRMYFRGKIGRSNTPAGPAAGLVDGKEGLLGLYPDRQLLLFPFSSTAEASAGLEACRRKASQDPAFKQVREGESGLVGTLTDGESFGMVQDGAMLVVTVRRSGPPESPRGLF